MAAHSILYAFGSVTDRTDPYEIIGVRRDASLAEIRISYRRSTQILAPERFANANDTVRAEAARRLSALNGAMEAIEAERAAESGSALGSLTFGGPAVSSAVEPSLRSVAIVDEPPPLVEEDAEATQDGVVESPAPVPEAPEALQARSEPHDEPIGLVEELAGEEPDLPTGEQSWIADDTQDELPHVGAEDTGTGPMPDTDDTHDGLAVILGEDTAQEPLAEPEADAEPAVSLLQTPNPPSVAAPAPAAPRFERERPVKGPSRTRSLLPRILGGCALLAALAAVGVYFLVGGGSSSTPKIGQFQRVGAPVSFSYPNGLVLRKPPSGGLLKPTFSTAVGLDAANYVVVATYRISANVQADGSADRRERQPPHGRPLRPVGRPRRRAHRGGPEAQGEGSRGAGQGRRHDRPRLRLHAPRRQQRPLRVRVPRAHRVLDRVLLGSRPRQGAERRLRPGHDVAAARDRLTPMPGGPTPLPARARTGA